jgi:uncharacterized damage-inducible protein DinB
LYDYGAWANERLLQLAEALPQEQVQKQWTQGSRSIFQNFVHLVQTDWRWFNGWQDKPVTAPGAEELATFGSVRASWYTLAAQRDVYFKTLTEAGLERTMLGLDGKPSPLPVWQAMVQCANHATQHRAEVAAMLTDAGSSPGDLDFVRWCFQQLGTTPPTATSGPRGRAGGRAG